MVSVPYTLIVIHTACELMGGGVIIGQKRVSVPYFRKLHSLCVMGGGGYYWPETQP